MLMTAKQNRNKMIAIMLFLIYLFWVYVPQVSRIMRVTFGLSGLLVLLSFIGIALVVLGLILNNKSFCVVGSLLFIIRQFLVLTNSGFSIGVVISLIAHIFFLLIFIRKKPDPVISGIVSAGLLLIGYLLNMSRIYSDIQSFPTLSLIKNFFFYIAILFTGFTFSYKKA